jgi:hypothetical protein
MKVSDVSEEDGGEMFLRNVCDFYQATWHYIPEDKNSLYSPSRGPQILKMLALLYLLTRGCVNCYRRFIGTCCFLLQIGSEYDE